MTRPGNDQRPLGVQSFSGFRDRVVRGLLLQANDLAVLDSDDRGFDNFKLPDLR